MRSGKRVSHGNAHEQSAKKTRAKPRQIRISAHATGPKHARNEPNNAINCYCYMRTRRCRRVRPAPKKTKTTTTANTKTYIDASRRGQRVRRTHAHCLQRNASTQHSMLDATATRQTALGTEQMNSNWRHRWPTADTQAKPTTCHNVKPQRTLTKDEGNGSNDEC
jgi:hypothetical protein